MYRLVEFTGFIQFIGFILYQGSGSECIAIKLQRAHGGCLGARSRRRTQQAAKRFGEVQATYDPEISEWGNP